MRLPSPQVNKSVFNSCLCPISNITTTYILSKLQLKLKSARGLYKPLHGECACSRTIHVRPSLSLSLSPSMNKISWGSCRPRAIFLPWLLLKPGGLEAGLSFSFFLFLDRKRFTWPKAPPSGVFSRGDFVSRAQGGGQLVLAWQTGVDLGQARSPAVQGQSVQGQRVRLEE